MNLIICITPLQSLIAQQIIRQSPNHPASHWACLYLPYGDNPKHRYYYGQLQSLCQTAAYIELKNKGLSQQLTTLQHINKTLKQLGLWQQPVAALYLASIDVIFIQYVLSKVGFKSLYTFDDGTANIFPNSSYFNPLPKSTAQTLFKKIIGIRYPDIASILAVSRSHYTIFPHEKNIISDTKPVQLFDPIQTTQQPIVHTQKILLGQGLESFIGEMPYRTLVEQMIERFGISHFVPHPREKLDFSDVLTVIQSDKIIEDYLAAAITEHPKTQYEIYTFMSTAVFSLSAFPRTQIFLVYNQALMAQFQDAYAFLASRGFHLIDMDAITV